MASVSRSCPWDLRFPGGEYVREEALQGAGQDRHGGDGAGYQGGVREHTRYRRLDGRQDKK